MAKRIKGITIEIDGNTKGLDKALGNVNKQAGNLQKELRDVEKLLKFNPGNTEAIAQKQKILADQIANTSDKLNTLRSAQKQVKEQFDKNQISEEQYRNFRREIEFTESELGKFEKSLATVKAEQEKQGESLQDLERLFKLTGKNINDFSDVLGNDMVRAIQSGKAATSDLDNAFNKISESALGAGKDIDKIKETLSRLDSGDSLKDVSQAIEEIGDASAGSRKNIAGLENALSGVSQEADTLQKELKDVEKLLKIDPGNAEAIAQKQKLLADQVANTAEKLNVLQNAQKRVTEQFENNQISDEQYRNFRREIEYTEAELGKFEQSLSSLKNEQSKQGESLRDLGRLFQLTGQNINDFSDVIGNDMVRAIQNGKASSTDLDNAFRKISESALGAGKDIDKIKDALVKLDSGDSPKKVAREIDTIGQASDEAKQSVNGLGSEIAGLAAGAAGIVGVGAAIEKALDLKSLDTNIDISFNIDDSGKKEVRQAVYDIQAYGVQGEEALEGLRRQFALNANESAKSNVEIVKGAAAITRAYSGVDLTEVVQEVNEIASELKITDKEALNLVNDLLAIGFPPDQIDIIAEYGSQLKRAGFEAKDVKAILASAVETGSWNIDSLLDGLKEGRIRAAEMGAGLSSGMKNSLRAALNTTKAASAEQLAVMRENFDSQERSLEKSLSNRESSISKSYEQQKQAVSNAHEQEYEIAAKAYSKQEKALEKRLTNEYEQTSKNLDRMAANLEKANAKEAEALDKKLNAQYDKTLKTYERMESDLEKSYAKQERALEKKLNTEYDKTTKNYDRLESNLERSLDKEMKAFEKAADKKLKLIDREYTEKMKLVDEERYKKIKAIDNEINQINDTAEAEAKAIEQRENNERMAELKIAIAQAKTAEQRAAAQEALADFEEKLRLDKIKEEREATLENLKDQKDAINESYDAKKEKLQQELDEKKTKAQESIKAELDALERVQEARKAKLHADLENRKANLQEANKAELEALREMQAAGKEKLRADLDNRKANLQEANKAELDALREVQSAQREKLAEQKADTLKAIQERNQNELEGFREVTGSRLGALKDQQEAEEAALAERLNAQLEGVREANSQELEAFKKMNNQKLELAKNPPDSQAFKDMEKQLETWGKAIAQGGEKGSKAFKEMVSWLNSIEDETTRNIIGTELFGTMWEDQGDNLIKIFTGLDDAQKKLDENTNNLSGSVKKIDADPMVTLQKAAGDLLIALEPLLTVIADVVKAIADFAIKNPGLTSTLVAVGAAVAGLIGFAIALAPVITAVVGVMGALGVGLTAALGPIALVVAAVVGIIALAAAIILNWEPITEFFSELWSDIVDVFTEFGSTIADYVSENWKQILASITGPIGLAVLYIVEHWDEIKDKTVEIFEKVSEKIGSAIQYIKDLFTSLKLKFPSLATDMFTKAREIVYNVIEKIKEFFAKLSLKFPSLSTDMFSRARDFISGVITKIKSFFSGLSLKFPSLSTDMFSRARDTISGIVETIKSFFSNLDLSFPSIQMPPLPHFSISGDFSLNPPSVPTLDIDWYKKGGVFSSASVIGVGEEPGVSEAVIPLKQSVLSEIGAGIAKSLGGMGGGDIIIQNMNVRNDNDIRSIAQQLHKLQRRDGRGRG